MKIIDQEVINSFNKSIKITEIAKIHKISISKVYYILNKNNIKYRKNKDLPTILNKDNLTEKYNELGSLKAVGRFFNISPSSIKKYMIEYVHCESCNKYNTSLLKDQMFKQRQKALVFRQLEKRQKYKS
jgi:translation initiation factor 2 beta subunit (eIF-2beta)/eIF-5